MTFRKLGAIADDLTGATDLAIALTEAGFRTIVVMGDIEDVKKQLPPSDAVVMALKTRSDPVTEAVHQSLRALRQLQKMSCDRFYFKYCSTFDSTADGNIGPVAEALLETLEEAATIVVPSFPATGRTVFKGHLFVGESLLAESPMRDHPLNPMKDSSVVRLLAAQSASRVALIDWGVVSQGANAVRDAFADRVRKGARLVVVDALTEADLESICEATESLRLITGGSGLAVGLPGPRDDGARHVEVDIQHRITLAGSASAATERQIAHALGSGSGSGQVLDIERLQDDFTEEVASIVRTALAAVATPHVIYAPPLSDTTNGEDAHLIEATLSSVGAALVEAGVGALMVAGGETAGAVAKALGVEYLETGPAIDPGVAWSLAVRADGPDIALALKSGNFGGDDIFSRAWECNG